MAEKLEKIWKDCNCMNCRLARIEDNVDQIKNMIANLPLEFEKGPEDAGS